MASICKLPTSHQMIEVNQSQIQDQREKYHVMHKSPLESKSTTPFSSLALVSLYRHLDSARGSMYFEWKVLKILVFFCTFLCPCFCLRFASFFPVLSIKVEVTTVELSQPFMKTETDGFQTRTNNFSRHRKVYLFPPSRVSNHIPPTILPP